MKNLSKYFLIFIILTGIQLLLLIISAVIPGKAIHSNMLESADYLSEKPVFYNISYKDCASRIDRYADSILLGIIHGYNSDKPLTSVMSSSYYHTDTENENINLKNAVYNDLKPNYEYSRYWHGSIAYMKPMLIFFNIHQIYIINVVVLALMVIAMLFIISKYLSTGVAVCFLISAVAVSIWYVPFSLEYTWTLYIMLISSFIAIQSYRKHKSLDKLMPIFFVTGSITAYFDFLTTETLTLLMPLTFLIIMEYQAGNLNNVKEALKKCLKSGIVWGIGYISCWLAKWTLASIILGKNAFATALSSASVRMYGDSYNAHGIAQVLGALIRNMSCIFPFSHMGNNRFDLYVGFFITLLIIYYLIRQEKNTCILPRIFFLVALIPYIRYIVLANHSYIHYFFTYRAQMATIFCIALIFYYGTDKKLLHRKRRRQCKKKRK